MSVVQSGYCGDHSAVVGHTGCCNLFKVHVVIVESTVLLCVTVCSSQWLLWISQAVVAHTG